MLHRRKNRWLYGLTACITAVSINLATPTVSQAGWLDNILRGVLIWGVQSYQLSNLSDKDEENFGKQIHDELVNSGQISLYRNTRVTNYINDIGQKLAAQSTRPNINYVFSVVDDDSINAFATMGGRVYINTGLIETAANEAELASVIGHEIAHIAGKHAIEQMKSQARNQGILAAAGLDQSQIVQLGVAIALDFPHSRGDETEADNLGFDMLTKAGYAPEAMASFMTKLMNASGGGGRPTFLSTHPSTGDRVSRLQAKADSYSGSANAGLDEQRYRDNVYPLI
jgi:predicted Zn-dependent protease